MSGIDASLLEKIGMLLHGDRWKKPLAEQINISDRHIFRWVNEDRTCYPDLRDGRYLPDVLIELLESRRAETDQLLSQLQQYARPGSPGA